MSGYILSFYKDPEANRVPVREYLDNIPLKERMKVLKYAKYLKEHDGVLDEPFSKHIRGKIRELRVDFGHSRHRVFFFTFINKNIVLLHAFLKRTPQTPEVEIIRAENNYLKISNNPEFYEKID